MANNVINTLGQIKLGWRDGSSLTVPTITPLLDLYSGSSAAYSLRKLRTGATASIRVRRSSDSEETDIAFNTDGTLDTTTLLSFAGSFNGIGYSQDIDNSYWTKYNSTITANSDLAPDGTMTADMMTETTTSAPHGIYRYMSSFGLLGLGDNYPWLTSATFSWNMSFYAKKANGNTLTTGQNILLLCQDLGLSDGGSKATFDLDYGVATLGTTTFAQHLNALGATMSNEGNGWWRCSMWGSANSYATNRQIPASIVRTTNRNTSNYNNANISGNTGAKYLIWGLQYKQEEGVSGTLIEPYTKTTNGGYGGYAHIVRWYDQSGNGRHVSQGVALSQPVIVKLKQVAMTGGKPVVKFMNYAYNGMYGQYLGYSGMSLTGTFSLFIVSKFDNTSNSVAVGGNTATNNWLNAIINGKFANYVNGYVYGDNPNTDRNLNYLQKTGASVTIGRNGGNNYTGSNNSMTLTGISIGAGNSTTGENRLMGDVQEVVLYNSNKTIDRYSIDNNINSYYSIYTPTVDTDAQTFITAASITNSTQQTAIYKLVNALKSYGLWSKMRAVYPFVGGNATSHSLNLINTGLYGLTFSGGWTHSSTGALPNGTTGYANTNLNLSTCGLVNTNFSHSTYVRGNVASGTLGGVYTPVLMGGWFDSVAILTTPVSTPANTRIGTYMANTWSEQLQGTVTSIKGLILGNRPSSSTVFTLHKNDVRVSTSASFSVRNFPNLNYYIGAYNSNGTAASFDNKEIAFYHIGTGLSDTDVANLYYTIQQFQTDLGRQV